MSNGEQSSRLQQSNLHVKVQYDLVITRAYRVIYDHD